MASSSSSSTKKTLKKKRTTTTLSVRPKTVRIKQQTGADNTYYATWEWSKSPTDHYEAKWSYYTGDGVKFPISTDTVTTRLSVCSSVPSNATSISVEVRAWGPNYKKESNREDDSNVPQWKTNWTNKVTYYLKHDAPKEPGTPTLSVDGNTLTVELNIDPYELNCKYVSFSIFRADGTYVKTSPKLEITNKYVRWTTTVGYGYEYKARVFTYNVDGEQSDPGDYSGNIETVPSAVKSITSIKAISETSVQVYWNTVRSAKSYEVEYATDKSYFDASGEVKSTTVTTNYAMITGLESGKEWFFRVRAINDAGESEWTDIKSIIIGKAPSAPTTWSSTTTAIVGDIITLYWVHNSEDNSSQTLAQLMLDINGSITTITVPNDRSEEDKDKVSAYPIDTSQYIEGTQIRWRVCTKGIAEEYSEWSVVRTIDVYAKPSIMLEVTDYTGVGLGVLTSFPINIYATTSPTSQIPLSYNLSVIANQSYETEDELGNVKMVTKDSEVFQKFFDISTDFSYVLSAGNIHLENDMSYTIKCVVAMDSGLTAEDTHIFTVGWGDYNGYEPELELTLNEDAYSMTLLPYCAQYPLHYYKLKYLRGVYIRTDEEITEQNGELVEGKETPDGDQVYKITDSQGATMYYTVVEDTEGILVEGVTLSVYRREYDGSFVEIGSGIPNDKSSYLSDPHPSLDYARYRVVATDIATGSIVYSDVSGVEIDCPYVLIQWDENWSNFDIDEDSDMTKTEPDYTGSLLAIKGNIDVSDKNDTDVSLIEYIGRKHPVSYYGTQLGITSSWNMEFPKDDKDTLYTLRRLAIWMGDVYVREPSGSGYWAHISVSFNQKHLATVIPVTMDITRVEGGGI